ncbi:cystathionine beta-lyase [Terriglobus roseus]|uniref:Cystathionine beta-lyase n=1 Tax=Terriglobus roseus TaxID=392734 RepID=A0A1G7K9Z2_9BACT|nr:cystathionine beta-lyase [Terriglobus roseus]SDF33976.1 cystathionine beta-lyase [Terriglobus roseus]
MDWRTRLLHAKPELPENFESLASATHRGSTVVFPSMEGIRDGWRQSEIGYSYGIYGTPTAMELAARIAAMEGARHTFLAPSGMSAIALVDLAFTKAGDHILIPVQAYGPNVEAARNLLGRYGVEAELYDATIGGGIASLIRDNTTLIWCESPGSITMEVQDVPAIVAAAHARGVVVAIDNTYAAGVLFDAFAHGVDVSVQALTKYVGGHSDLLLGSVSVATEDGYERVGATRRMLGLSVSPDECSLALRGLQTLVVRLEKMERSTLEIAKWLTERSEIDVVLHPALPSCPGHEIWKRDFTGSASVFSMLFSPRYSPDQVNAFVDRLELFKIGWSWGGVNSLVMAYPTLTRIDANHHGRIVRLNIGLEEPSDLIEDLERSLSLLG